MLELYVITDWNQAVASLVEAVSKSDAFRKYLLHTNDWSESNQVDVDYRGPLYTRPFVEAEVELFNLGMSHKTVPIIDFADAMIQRWKEAKLKQKSWYEQLDANKLLRANIKEIIDECDKLDTEVRSLGSSNVSLKEQIDDLRHLVGYQEHELETMRYEKLLFEPIVITVKKGCVIKVDGLLRDQFIINDLDIPDEDPEV